MLCIPKIVEYLEILTDKEVKGFVVKKFGKCIKSTTEELYSKLDEEKSF